MYYSPVRHSPHPKMLLVRLACVRHAASVRSEPGSNSQLDVSTSRVEFTPESQFTYVVYTWS